MSDLTRASCCGRALILSAPTRASKILCTVLAYPGETKSAKNQAAVRQANRVDAGPMGRSLYVIMAVMAVHLPNEREGLVFAASVFGVIGAVLILLAPAKQLGQRVVRNP